MVQQVAAVERKREVRLTSKQKMAAVVGCAESNRQRWWVALRATDSGGGLR
jgi:hypothetical protein